MHTVAQAEDRALNAHLARQDKFAELGDMAYADLTALENDLGDNEQWSLLDDVRHELALRKAEGMGALTRVFADAIKTNSSIPWVDFTSAGKKLGKRDIAWWLREWAGTDSSSDKLVDLVLDPSGWAKLVGMLAADYAKNEGDELLCAGWQS